MAKVQIRLTVSQRCYQRIHNLAELRYPDQEDAVELVVQDAIDWKLEQWDKYGLTVSDWIWNWLAHKGFIPYIKSIGWGKLVEPYFLQ